MTVLCFGILLMVSSDAYAAKLKKVENVRVTKEFTKALVIAYDKVSGAGGYQIQVSDRTGKIIKNIDSTYGNLMINGLEPSTIYYIKVRAYVNNNGKKTYSAYSDTLTAITIPAVVSGIRYTSEGDDTAGVSWDEQKGVSGYYIYKYDDDKSTWKLLSIRTTNSFTVKHLEPATEYLYKIKSYVICASKIYFSEEKEIGLTSVPEDVENLLCSYTGAKTLKFEWSQSLYASGYQINLYEKGGSRVRSVNQKETQIVFENLDINKKYYVIVRAYRLFSNGRKNCSGYAVCDARTMIAKVEGLTQTSIGTDSISFSFNKVDCADEYGIYKYCVEDESTELIGVTKETEYTVTGLEPNSFTFYKVAGRCIDEDKVYTGIMSDEIRINTDLSGISEYRVVKHTDDGFTVEFDPVNNGYQYKAYYRDPDTGKYKLFTTTDQNRITFTGLKDATYYDFVVLAVLKFGNETFNAKKTASRTTTAPKPVKLNGLYTSDDIYTVSWTKSSGQTGYDLWKYSDSESKWIRIGSTKKNSYDYKVTDQNDSLRFRVRPYITVEAGVYVCGEYSNLIDDPEGKIGIDVSSHQSRIDWQKVKADGISYAIIRIGYRGYTYGTIKMDEQFENNIKGALENGVDVGIYFFSTAISQAEAREEANWVLEHIRGYNVTYPIVFDYEGYENPDYRSYKQSKKNRTDYAIAFLDVIRENGYIPMMYGSQYYYKNEWETDRLAEKYSLWCAKYPTNSGVQMTYADLSRQPNIPWAYAIWQYTSIGKVSGISTNVDMNYQYTWFKI